MRRPDDCPPCSVRWPASTADESAAAAACVTQAACVPGEVTMGRCDPDRMPSPQALRGGPSGWGLPAVLSVFRVLDRLGSAVLSCSGAGPGDGGDCGVVAGIAAWLGGP